MSNVYFIQADGGGPIKIGTARNIKLRLQDLQCATSLQLKLLASVEAAPSIERALHRLLRPWRKRGEWFKAEMPVEALLANVISGKVTGENIVEWTESFVGRLIEAEELTRYLATLAHYRGVITDVWSTKEDKAFAKRELVRFGETLEPRRLSLKELLTFSIYLEDPSVSDEWVEEHFDSLTIAKQKLEGLLARLGPKAVRG